MEFEHPCASDPKPLHVQVDAAPDKKPCQQSRTLCISLMGLRRVMQGAGIEEPVSRNLYRPWSYQESLLQVQKPNSNQPKQYKDSSTQDLDVLEEKQSSEMVGFSG